MKRITLYLGLAAALMASCSTQEKDFQTPFQEDTVFFASFEQPGEEGTKVYANEDLLLRWTADDRVSIFNKNTYNQQYQFTGNTGANAGGFKKVETDEFMTGNAISHVVSVYPYLETTKISENETLSLVFPSEQHYAENTFGLGANTMVSVTSDNFLQYKNACGYLRISLYGEGFSVSSISLSGNDGERLAGNATVSMLLNGSPIVEMANDAVTEIQLICDSPVVLCATEKESIDFWFVVPPITFTRGFTITVTGKAGTFDTRPFVKTTSKSITIERNKLSKMSPMAVDVAIHFEDERIKAICVDNWDTNGDGELSYGEAAAVTTLQKGEGKDSCLFTNLDNVSFNELKCFIGLKELENAFESCSFRSIQFPSSLTRIGYSAFDRCDLRHCYLELPLGITSIDGGAFWGCQGCFLILPESVLRIQSDAFSGCGIFCIILPDSLKSIGMGAFKQCSFKHFPIIPKNVSIIEKETFSDGHIESFDSEYLIPGNIKTIDTKAFSNNRINCDISMGEGVERIGDDAFRSCWGDAKIVSIPSSVTKIGSHAFYDCPGLESITVKAGIPPVGGEGMFDETNDCPIYVPSESVDAYKATEYWMDYSSRIQAIPD